MNGGPRQAPEDAAGTPQVGEQFAPGRELAARPDTEDGVAVSCRGLSRVFGGTRAVNNVSLDIRNGSVHALVGQNGAGKSTFLGMIAGRVRPSAGDIKVLGKTFRYGDPRSSRAAGIGAVYQELSLIPHLTPQANVFLGQPRTRWGLLARRAMRNEYVKFCVEWNVPPAPDVTADRLSVAQQQLVEIMRAVASSARVILLDEPTASLAVEERQALFRLLAALRENGTTIVLVSHGLDEVLQNADVVSVFRNGQLIATREAREWTKREIIEHMLGDASRALIESELTGTGGGRSTGRESAAGDQSPRHDVALQVEHLVLPGRIHDASLELRVGEVVGLAGLMGSGRSSLLRSLAGAEPGAMGELRLFGEPRKWPSSPRVAAAYGIGIIAEDRKTEGICAAMSCADNVALPQLGAVSRWGYLSPRLTASRAVPLMERVHVKPDRVRHLAGTLSGGNQQKLLFARVGYQRPRILLADEPTRGVDVHAKEAILNEIRRLADEEGVAIAVVSSELEELLAFCDRIVVVTEGRLTHEFDNRDRTVSEREILHFAFPRHRAEA